MGLPPNIFVDNAIQPRQGSMPPLPDDPGVWETLTSAYDAAFADTTTAPEDFRVEAYKPIIDALLEADKSRRFTAYISPQRGTVSAESVWRDVERLRREKGMFTDLPKTQEEFEQQWRAKKAQEIDRAAVTASRGNGIVAFIGGAAGAMSDPVNLLTLPVGGGGRTVAQRIGTEALLNMGIEAILQPAVQRNRRELGRADLTFEEAATNIGFAGAGAAAIRGGIEIAPKGVDAVRSRFERVVSENWDRLPAPLRERWEARASVANSSGEDVLLADMVEELAGDNLPQLGRDAIEVVRREAALDQANVFRPDGAGAAMHQDMIEEVFARVLSDTPLPEAGRFAARVPDTGPVRRFEPDRDPVVAASHTGPVGPAIGSFMQRVRGKESSGDDGARNPRSSATGRYQFIDSTWLAYYKRRYGSGGKTDAQILALRGDGRLQDILMRDLTEDNARFLRSQGQAVTEGNLYLVHFAGQRGASKVLAAAPDARVSGLLGADVIAANPFLRDMTAEDMLRWAHRAMDQRLPPRGAAPTFSDALSRNQAEREAAQQAMDQAVAQAFTAAEAQRAAARGEPDPFADLPEPVRVDGDDMQSIAPIAPRADMADVDPEIAVILPALERIAADPGRALNATGEIASELGVPTDAVRQGLRQLARQGRLTENNGLFMRRADFGDDSPRANAVLEQVRQLAQDTRANLNDIAGLARRLEATEAEVTGALDRMVGKGELKRALKVGVDARGRRRRLPTGKYLRPRAGGPRAATDIIGMIASMGGIRPDGRAPRFDEGGAPVGQARKRAGHDLRNTGSLDHFVPGIGPLLRPGGMSLDEVGEFLWERGVFGPSDLVDRPSESDVIAFLDDVITNKRDIDPDTGMERMAEPDWELEDIERGVAKEETAVTVLRGIKDLGMSEWIDDDLLDDLIEAVLTRPDDLSEGDALYYALNVMAARNQDEAFANSPEPSYEAIDYDEAIHGRFPADREAPAAGDDLAGYEPAGIDPEAGGIRGGGDGPDGSEADGRALVDLTPEQRAPFLDPQGEAVKAQAHSLEHDARVALERLPPAAPSQERVAGIGYDNPGGEWLERQRERTSDGRLGATTAYTKDVVEFDPNDLAGIPGRNGERPAPGQPKYDNLMESVEREGWKGAESPILISIDKDGNPFIMEGNNRVAVARALGEKVSARVQWHTGGELADGPLTPAKVRELTSKPATTSLDRLPPAATEDEMFAAMRDLPDTDESQLAMDAARARLWDAAGDADGLDAVIGRFDAARERWDQQYDDARNAASEAFLAQKKVEQAALAEAIAERVNAGTDTFRMANPIRNRINEYGAGTVRVRNGQLEVIEGQNWVGIPSSDLARIAQGMGINLENVATPSRAPAVGGPAPADDLAARWELRRPADETPSAEALAVVRDMRRANKEGAMIDKKTPDDLAREFALGFDAAKRGEPKGGDYDNNVMWLHGFDRGQWEMNRKPPAQADFAAPTQDQRRIALERQTEGRMRGTVPQRAAGSDGGLFDTRDTTGDLFDAPTVRLDPEGGDEMLRDMIEEFDREASELKTIRDCL